MGVSWDIRRWPEADITGSAPDAPLLRPSKDCKSRAGVGNRGNPSKPPKSWAMWLLSHKTAL